MGYPEKRGKTWRARFAIPGVAAYGSESGWRTKGEARDRADELEILVARGAWAQRHGRVWSAHYRKADGTYHEEPGFGDQAVAQEHAERQRATVRNGMWLDPAGASTTLRAWWGRWRPTLEDMGLSHNTLEAYDSRWHNHVEPRWGDVQLGALMSMSIEIAAWEAQLGTRRSQGTAKAVGKLLTLLLADAVRAGLIPATPVRPHRRRGRAEPMKERAGVAVGLEVVIALMRRMRTGYAMLTLTKWCTGMRYGEVAGMRRKYLVLVPPEVDDAGENIRDAEGYYVIDAEVGALHEPLHGKPYFGPPKGYKGRTVELPPFLVELLLAYIATIGEDDVLFRAPRGGLLRSATFRDAWRAACDGHEQRPARRGVAARPFLPPVQAGLVPHDMRHSHKTRMDDWGIPSGAKNERLGHADLSVPERYSHGSPVQRAAILAGLQADWESLGEKWEISTAIQVI